MARRFFIFLCLVLALFFFFSDRPLTFADDPTNGQPIVKDHARYQRFGGSKGLNAIVDELMHITAEDERINTFFVAAFSDPVRMKTFKIRFVDQICELIGGPCHTLGKTMPDAHAGMGIKGRHFKAFLEDLILAMNKNQVEKKDQKYLIKRLKSLKEEIVNAPAKATPTMGAGGFR